MGKKILFLSIFMLNLQLVFRLCGIYASCDAAMAQNYTLENVECCGCPYCYGTYDCWFLEYHLQTCVRKPIDDSNTEDDPFSETTEPTDETTEPTNETTEPTDLSDNNRRPNNDATPKDTINTYNIQNAIDHLNERAYSYNEYKNLQKTGRKGKCAQYVRCAIEAGGIDTSVHPVSAKDYGPYLQNWGFREISRDHYVPRTGDIRVWQPYSGGNPNGHIHMFNGSAWVSDFVEPNLGGPSAGYRANNVYKIYRK